MSFNNVLPGSLLRDLAAGRVDELESTVAELECTVDGLDDAVRDREKELKDLRFDVREIAKEVDLLKEVPLSDLESAVWDLATRLADLGRD